MRTCVAALALAGALSCAHAQGASLIDVTRSMRASWYDCKRPGECSASKRTANGERFNSNAMTCAHRKLKFGTHLRDAWRPGRQLGQ